MELKILKDLFSKAHFRSLSTTSANAKNEVKERLLFLSLFIKHHNQIGSLTPSSKALAKEITRLIPEKGHTLGPRRYLDIGSGTGPFAEEMVAKLNDTDSLDLIELDPELAAHLVKKFANKPNVHVYCVDITKWNTPNKYDAIVSGLPLNAFSPEFVHQCIASIKSLAKPNATISWFDYPTLSKYGRTCLGFLDRCRKEKKKPELEQVLAIKEAFFKIYGMEKQLVKQRPNSACVSHFKIQENNALPVPPVSEPS